MQANAPSQRSNIRATPTDIVAAMLGTPSVTLQGFESPPVMPAWLRPGMTFVAPNISTEDLGAEISERERKASLLRKLAYGQMALAMAAVTFWLGSHAFSSSVPTPAAAWHVKAISDRGVEVQIGATVVLVQRGSKLPNGETLIATAPERRTYFTDTSTVTTKITEQAK
jgi:hypothetical protein